MQSNILVCVCAAVIFPGFGNNTDGIYAVDPFLRSHCKIVVSGLASKRIEFDTVKIWIIQLLPQPYILNCIDPAHPILYDKSWIFRIFIFCNIRKREIIVLVDMDFLIQYDNFFVLHYLCGLSKICYFITHFDRIIERKTGDLKYIFGEQKRRVR